MALRYPTGIIMCSPAESLAGGLLLSQVEHSSRGVLFDLTLTYNFIKFSVTHLHVSHVRNIISPLSVGHEMLCCLAEWLWLGGADSPHLQNTKSRWMIKKCIRDAQATGCCDKRASERERMIVLYSEGEDWEWSKQVVEVEELPWDGMGEHNIVWLRRVLKVRRCTYNHEYRGEEERIFHLLVRSLLRRKVRPCTRGSSVSGK